MTPSFSFHFSAGKTDLLIIAHREGEDIEIDHVWMGSADILPVLEYEYAMADAWLLMRIYEQAWEVKASLHREGVRG